MPVYKVNAIVLRRLELGETDRILRLLTREAGKVDAVAKGARRGTSRLSGATELFTYSRMLLATGKTLDVLSQCEIKESYPALRAELPTLARATYLCELVERMMEEREPNAEVFDLLLSALYLLQRKRNNPDVIVHSFELHLMAERGYRPELRRCVKCGAEIISVQPALSPSLGGALCGRDRFASEDSFTVGRDTLLFLDRLQHAEPEELIELAPSDVVLQETARCLKWYIRYRADRDLRSAEFLDMLRAQ